MAFAIKECDEERSYETGNKVLNIERKYYKYYKNN
jgi:hypothetical protein